MSEILIPRCDVNREALFGGNTDSRSTFDQNNAHAHGDTLRRNQPYCISTVPEPQSAAIIGKLNALNQTELDNLSCVIDQYGPEALALAELYDTYFSRLDLGPPIAGSSQGWNGVSWSEIAMGTIGVAGTAGGTGAAFLGARADGLIGAIREYQGALLALHAHTVAESRRRPAPAGRPASPGGGRILPRPSSKNWYATSSAPTKQ